MDIGRGYQIDVVEAASYRAFTDAMNIAIKNGWMVITASFQVTHIPNGATWYTVLTVKALKLPDAQ